VWVGGGVHVSDLQQESAGGMQDEIRRRWKQRQQQDSSKGIRKAAARCVCPRSHPRRGLGAQ
jgi:hypothetical protein